MMSDSALGLWEGRGRLCRATATTSSAATRSKSAGEGQADAVDVVERVRAGAALHVCWQHPEPGNFDAIQVVQPQVPTRQQVAPLRPRAEGKPIGRRA